MSSIFPHPAPAPAHADASAATPARVASAATSAGGASSAPADGGPAGDAGAPEATPAPSAGHLARSDAGRPPTVAYQGEPGAFSEEALRLHFGDEAVPLPSPTFRTALEAVVHRDADFAVIPVENSGAGPVTEAHHALAGARVPLQECARIVLPLRQMLLAPRGATFDALREVRSHPVALAQCARFLAAHPHLTPRPVADTAGAAREIAALGDPTLAALASARAGEAHGLVVVRPDVHDDPRNRTTFVVVRRAAPDRPTPDRPTPNRPAPHPVSPD